VKFNNPFFEAHGIFSQKPVINTVVKMINNKLPEPLCVCPSINHAYEQAFDLYDALYRSGEVFNGTNIGEAFAYFDPRFILYCANCLNADGSRKADTPPDEHYSDEHIAAVQNFLDSNQLSQEQIKLLYDVIALEIYDSF